MSISIKVLKDTIVEEKEKMIIDIHWKEVEVYKKYKNYYGYVFFIIFPK